MLTRLVEVAESDPQIGMVGPTMYCADPPNMIWGGDNWIDWRRARMIRHRFGELESKNAPEDRQPQEVDYIDTCAILVKRQVVEKIGLMNGDYFINFDDLDWNIRARKASYKIVYVPSAQMWHKVSATMGFASPATTYYMTRNALLFFWTHAPGIWKALAPLQIVLRTARTIGAWTLKSQYRTEAFRRKRDANLLALRDFFLGRFGKMGPDVARVCYGD
jgi:GT2 family glycosyltransferase